VSDGADVVIIGGGIAGLTVAHHLAPHRRVMVIEAEPTLAHHTTGRSAAQYLETYGGAVNQSLTLASRHFFFDPPPDLVDHDLLTRVPFLHVGGPDDRELIEAEAARAATFVPGVAVLDRDGLRRHCPVLRPEAVGWGVLEPDAMDIDVMALHQAFVRGSRRHDAVIATSRSAQRIEPRPDGWRVHTSTGPIDTHFVVNAAGAWGDVVAERAGIDPLGLTPLRRTAFTSAPATSPVGWPLVHTHVGSATLAPCYFKPEAGGQLLCSLADESPAPPGDARPNEVDVALALDHLDALTTLGLRSVRRAWAGLRTFTPDRQPAIGWEPTAPGFFWMVGQGGTGIQTAPASGALAAALIMGVDPATVRHGPTLDPAAVSPARFRA